MTNADILAIAIGVLCGILAGVPTAILILIVQARAAMQRRQEPPDLDFYPGQIIVIERPMLKDGER